MIVRELGVENFRKFRQPIRLAGFDSGLNLVCEPNETGKSTVLEALRAVLFERHSSKSERILSFRPHGDDVAPIVDLKFEVADATWTVRKRFLQKPEVMLEGPGVRATGDEAEERLQVLLGFARAGNRGADENTRGALGLLWLEQGASFVLGAPGQAARRTIEEVLAGEVGAVTAGRRTAAVVQAVEKSLGELFTATGRPTRRLAVAQDIFETTKSNAAAAQQELADFEAVLNRLDAKRSENRRLIRDLEDPDHAEQLRALDADIQRARVAGQALKTAEVLLREATGQRERLADRAEARGQLRIAVAAAELDLAKATTDAADQAAALALARQAEAAAAAALESARDGLRLAEDERRAGQRLRTSLVHTRALTAAFNRLDTAEALAKQLETVREEIAASSMTDEAAEELDDAERNRVSTRSAATAGAATLKLDLLDASPEARLNGEIVARDHTAAVIGAQALELSGVGRIVVEPPLGGEAAQAAVRAAEDDLSALLARLGFATPAEARAAARRRSQAEQTAAGLAGRLADACPPDGTLGIGAGVDTLRGALAQETRPQHGAPANEAPDSVDEDARWETARADERTAEGRREAAVAALGQAEREEIRLTGALDRARAEHQRLADDLAVEAVSQTDEVLDEDLTAARTSESRALIDHDQARRAAEGLDEAALGRRREGMIQKLDRMREDRLGLVQEIAMLEERAKTLGGAGPASRAVAADELVDAAQTTLGRLQEEAETLALLDRVIREAQQEASRKFLAPITNRVAPYINRLLPNSSVAFSDDYTPERLIRGGREEVAEHLSKGTQEQLAVLTRIAFADLLIEKGKPASLILDDALVFADDDRFETMLEILTEAAGRMQIIVLACRASAYRGLPGKRIDIG